MRSADHDSPRVTIVTPVCNGERYLRAALDSLLAQAFRDFVVLVVDDASTDGTAAMLRSYTDSRIRVLHNTVRLGPAGSRNRALDEARSRYVAFFDADDIAHQDRFARQVTFLQRRPDVHLLAARVAVMDEGGRHTGEVWGYDGDERMLEASMLFANGVPTSTVIVERALVADERFDASLGIASDYDMWVRLLDRGSGAVSPDVLVSYRNHDASRSHVRQDAAEACLRRIAADRLARLGLTPTEEEMNVHLALGTQRVEGSPSFLRAAEAWLARLHEANAATGVYAPEPFRRVLLRRWLDVLEASARAGRWEALNLVRSSFGRWACLDAPARTRMARLPWHTVRGTVRKRWPRLGPAVRQVIPPRQR